MEDRITPCVYLEMTNLPAERYAQERAPELRKSPGVDRVTWWENCLPGSVISHVGDHRRYLFG